MFHSLEKWFFQRKIARGQMAEEEVELYRYAYSLLFMQAGNLLAAAAIGICFRAIPFLALFLLIFIPLRSFAGGYHASTPFWCSVLSALMELGVAGAFHFGWLARMEEVLFLVAWGSGLVIGLTAPLEAKNKPLDDGERKLYGRRARQLLAAALVVMSVSMFAGVHLMIQTVSSALILEAVLMLVGKSRM